MQIQIVDDCSTSDNPEMLVRQLGKDRVEFYRQPENLGAMRNFNSCIARSVGQLIHVLNADDWVLPGFYDRIELSARRHPQVSLFGTRNFIYDGSGNLESLSGRTVVLEHPSKDVAPFLYGNPFCTPGMVIRRQLYEDAGGFNPDLIYTGDWEMWIRAISIGGGCMINQPLACYRRHADSMTGHMARTSGNLRDFLRLADIFQARYAHFSRKIFNQMLAKAAQAQAQHFRRLHDTEAADANDALCREIIL